MRDHAQIVAAIAAGDSALAPQKVRQHLPGTLARLDDIRPGIRNICSMLCHINSLPLPPFPIFEASLGLLSGVLHFYKYIGMLM